MPALGPGDRLGPFEIVAPLGAGGMGEVYRGRDARIGREVAIKVLPRELADDADRLRRFEQEARAVGQLNHPNLLTLHDLGDEGGRPFLVTELLEGRNLREQLGEGPLPLRRAVDLAAQIARGLAAAHEKSVVHRDLKPENIFVTRDGRAKILDFGLAKQRTGGDIENGRTVENQTDPGTILGTVGYMSPEQIRGLPADSRSDLFALGSVLYEMLAGRRAFARESAMETLSAILRDEPPEPTSGGRPLPPVLGRILRRLLEKEPDLRFQSATDLAFDLESAVLLSEGTHALAPPAASASARLGAAALVGAGLVVGLAAAWLALAAFGRDAAAEPSFQRVTFRRGNLLQARFAPDGQTVVYAAAWDGRPAELFVARAETGEARPLGVERANLLGVSTRGELAVLLKERYLVATSGQGTLARLPLVGGPPRALLEGVLAADWSPDGADLAVLRAIDGKTRLEYPLGRSIAEWGALGPYTIRLAPDGERVALWEAEADGSHSAIVVVDRRGDRRPVSGGWDRIDSLAWSPGGRELLVTGRFDHDAALWAVALDGERRVLYRSPDRLALHDVTRDGRLLVERETSRLGLAARTPGEDRERELAWLDYSVAAGLSADGRWLLFGENGEGGGARGAAYLRSTDGSVPVRLGEGRACALSPDGNWALTLTGSPPELVLVPTGAGEPKRVPTGGLTPFLVSWFFPDGRRLLFAASAPSGEVGVFATDPDAGEPRRIAGEEVVDGVGISPDGAWVAFLRIDGRVALYPTAGGEARFPDGFEPGEVPIAWSADGRALFVRRKGELPERIFRVDLATAERDLWRTLVPADETGVIGIDSVALAPGAGAYAYSYSRITTSDLYVASGIRLR